jgi:uncharacterized alpha-E superfamily protein
MLSRVADSLYWMSRYVERAENIARFIDVNEKLTDDTASEAEIWAPLIYASGDWPQFVEKYRLSTRENVLTFLTFDTDSQNSIVSCARLARENARAVRESISTPMWEELNKFYLTMSRAAYGREPAYLTYEFFNEVKLSCHLFRGVSDATLSRGEGWHFVRLGRLVERADKTSRIVDVKTYGWTGDSAVENQLAIVHWSSLLHSVSALEMYRRLHGRIRPTNVARFLLLDGEFPRSVRYCLRGAESSLHAMTGTATGNFSNRAEQLIGRLRAQLDYTRIEDILHEGLHDFIDRLQGELNQIGGAIEESFFPVQPAPAGA